LPHGQRPGSILHKSEVNLRNDDIAGVNVTAGFGTQY